MFTPPKQEARREAGVPCFLLTYINFPGKGLTIILRSKPPKDEPLRDKLTPYPKHSREQETGLRENKERAPMAQQREQGDMSHLGDDSWCQTTMQGTRERKKWKVTQRASAWTPGNSS